ncbi:MAG: glycoside hydrolase family 2 [Clostridia bacterium]|nr:glycoside hydrolase family 2 [Clostridia bacterium]
MKSAFSVLKTPFERSDSHGWETEYPRPQFKRESFISLCGKWKLFVGTNSSETYAGNVRVPFPTESRLSGIERTLQKGEHYRYTKTFELQNIPCKQRLILHFGAVDQVAEVAVNGQSVGKHEGGYLPFSFDITEFVISGENTLSVVVVDTLDQTYPYGKQRKKRGGMWYTPISGIWQPVWMEWVPEHGFASIQITPTTHSVTIKTVGGEQEKQLTLFDGTTYAYSGDTITISFASPHLWSPEDPFLYDFTLTDGVDRISSYFALRTVTAQTVNGKPTLCLNDKPYFFHGVLDQGYFSDGIYLPADPDGYVFDIQTMKRLGFNTLRKHIKVEPDLFYYYCDRLGMVVFQDMVNNGKYHFIWDTALPTVGLKRLPKLPPTKNRKNRFEQSCEETIAHLYNHPCVCYYTIFNEGWGQFDSDRIYAMLKKKDGTRIWDTTSGWFFRRDSDVQSEHVYFRKVQCRPSSKPIVLSEFGGYACKIADHVYNLKKDYGYKTCPSTDRLEHDLQALYGEQIVPSVWQGLCAAILTQLSDVEDEINGLVTYDRQVVKVSESTMQQVSDLLWQAFEGYHNREEPDSTEVKK